MSVNIVILGPVSPYRGGIAQYTDRLVKALRTVADVKVVSFKRQYPKFLYPGETDRVKGEKLQSGVSYILDSNSPLSWSRTAEHISSLNPDVVVMSWWTLFWQPGLSYIARRLKKKGIKTIFYCHNIFDHDSPKWKQKLSTFFLRSASAYVVHSKDQKKILQQALGDVKVMQRIHPVYDHFPPVRKPVKRSDAKLKLLFFGFIRPYKGLDDLLTAMKYVKRDDVELKVVGESWKDTSELIDQAKGLPVTMNFKYVDDAAVGELFEGSDVVVLPYKKATGSGVVAAAYFYGKPVIATKVEGLVDTVTESTGWLVPPSNPKKLAATIDDLTSKDVKAKTNALKQFCKENSWDNMAKAIVEFVEEV